MGLGGCFPPLVPQALGTWLHRRENPSDHAELKRHRPFMFSLCHKFRNGPLYWQFKDVRVKVSAIQPSHNSCKMASTALNIWEGKGKGSYS